jgi:hypothetical protein
VPNIFPRGQWHARLETFELDSGTRARPQQPIRRLTERSSTLRRIVRQSGIECCEEDCNVLADTLTQHPIDKSSAYCSLVRLPCSANGSTIICRRIIPPGCCKRSLLFAARPSNVGTFGRIGAARFKGLQV